MTNCDCGIELSYYTNVEGDVIHHFDLVGEINGQHAFQGTINGELVSIWWNLGKWTMSFGDILIEEIIDVVAEMYQDNVECPITTSESGGVWVIYWTKDELKIEYSDGISCENPNCGKEDRMFRQFDSIKLPQSFTEQNRGFKDCCCEQIVLASTETETWKNDVTSAWIKLSSTNDTAIFKLKYEDGSLASTISAISFVNEPNAFYGTVEWAGILNALGEGCYKLEIEYNISGITGTIKWGTYKLKRYSIQSALTTARVSAIFDGYHEIEGINFSGSNVPSTFRFRGFIGFRQPNYEIDNLIYGDRQMKRNLRENLNSYEIITEASDECIIRPLV